MSSHPEGRTGGQPAAGAHAVPLRLYFAVFASLLVLTALTVHVAGVDLGPWNTAVALLIASLKAGLVLLFFMHLWWSSRLSRVFAAAGFFFLVLLISLTLSDFLSRGWLPVYGAAG